MQADADPGNRFAVPYLHAMNGVVYNVEAVRRRMPQAPLDSLALVFDRAAQTRARENSTGVQLAFMLPKEGSNITYNAFLITADAPHPEAAHRFLNFLLDPHVIASVTNDTHYGNDNPASNPYVRPEILRDPALYPGAELRAHLYLPRELGSDYDRLRTRAWTRIKTGQ